MWSHRWYIYYERHHRIRSLSLSFFFFLFLRSCYYWNMRLLLVLLLFRVFKSLLLPSGPSNTSNNSTHDTFFFYFLICYWDDLTISMLKLELIWIILSSWFCWIFFFSSTRNSRRFLFRQIAIVCFELLLPTCFYWNDEIIGHSSQLIIIVSWLKHVHTFNRYTQNSS